MVVKIEISPNAVPEDLQQTLNEVAGAMADRKNEIVDLLCSEQPTKSRQVDMSYVRCTWWEGCYYCQDEAKQWHRVKCFI
jgi:hypothetical protein